MTDEHPRDQRAPTLNDVAARAGVSRQTVSNVINAPERVRESTMRRVRQAIQDLGYRPHRNAQNLKNRSTNLLGYRVRPSTGDELNSVHDQFLHALSDAAWHEGFQILLFTSEDGAEEIAMLDELIATQTVDGFILSGTQYDDPRAEHLHTTGIPFAAFGRTGHPWPHAWVDVDNVAGTHAVVDHLVAGGRRRIAFVGWPDGVIAMDHRRQGYEQGMAAADLPLDTWLDARGTEGFATGLEAGTRWFDSPHPPDAVVACLDLLATGLLMAAREAGVVVGEDVAVVGYDDSPTAPYLTPPLSSVHQPIQEVAGEVLRQVVAAIQDGSPEPGVLIRPRLVVRDSSERNA